MPRQPHTKTPNRHYLALALAAVLGAPGAALAQDSGAGIDLQFGNPLDPTGQNLHDGCTPGGRYSAIRTSEKRLIGVLPIFTAARSSSPTLTAISA